MKPALIPMAKPVLGAEELQAVAGPLGSGWVSQGPEVAAFEREFAQYVGAEHGCAVSSCTTALHLALLALGVGPGDQVVTVSHSFIATANAVRYCGAVPVFIDILPATYNLDPNRLEDAIGPRTKAVLCVHQIGMPCDLAAILAVARRRGLAVIEDAACAIGSEIRIGKTWERIGKPHGDIACFSFHPRKVITTGDGGMLTTNNAEWDRRFRRWRQHSMSVPDRVRHEATEVIYEDYPEVGYNYRMTDIQAAIGRSQLKRLPEIVERRRTLARRYADIFTDMPGLALPAEPEWARSNWQSFCVRLPEGRDQRHVMQSMLDDGVATRRGVMCVHRERAYPPGTWSCGPGRACRPGQCRHLANSEEAQDHTILLPLFPQMTFEEQDRVAFSLRRALNA